MCDAALTEAVGWLLTARGLADGSVTLHLGATGGNNRVYVVEGAAVPLVAKKYFRSTRDQRDRLHAEWSFVNYAYGSGVDCVPQPIAADEAGQIALYERVPGRKLGSSEIRERDVLVAAQFFDALNRPVRRTRAENLPRASEAGFCIAEHFALIDRRIDRLVNADETNNRDAEANALIGGLDEYWRGLKTSIAREADELSLPLDETLPVEERCVSPSDFGFHNALQRPDGSLCFIDFEYAGWDDPAKMVADFFLQPEIPVDRKFYEPFVRATINGPRADWHKRRIELLQPIFAVKWCCIMLNPFVVERAQAGNFANPLRDETERKLTQLKKATAAFAALQSGESAWRT